MPLWTIPIFAGILVFTLLFIPAALVYVTEKEEEN